MLIHGLINIQDWSLDSGSPKKRPLRSNMMTKKVDSCYYLCVRNSMYPNCINYALHELEEVYNKFAHEGKATLRFKEPKHSLMVLADEPRMLLLFLQQVRNIVTGKNMTIGTRKMPKIVPAKKNTLNTFDPATTEFVAVERFDKRILNMRQLSTLVLENCVLPNLPTQIGHLPIKYLSLSASKLGVSQYDRDTLWDWMSEDTISGTLTTLKMDSIGLQMLPFEIMFLKNLQTLSVSYNKLKYLPTYIGQLKKLNILIANDNLLSYFPDSLFTRSFNKLDVSNNYFTGFTSYINDHISEYIDACNIYTAREADTQILNKLSNLSFYSLIENCVKFKRQDIPRSMWHYFNFVGRCIHCQQLVLPGNAVVHHSTGHPFIVSMTQNHHSNSLQWQSVQCKFKCYGPKRK